MTARILVVDDDPAIRRANGAVLAADHEVLTAEDGTSGLVAIRAHRPDVLVTDVRMPGGGIQFARAALELQPDLAVVVVSGEGTLAELAELLRMGVLDVLLKPTRPGDLTRAVTRALELQRLRLENERMRVMLHEPPEIVRLVGDGPAMRAVKERVARAAASSATVLITGSTGTGKEVVARSLHELGPRAAGPFVVVNCAAMVESLLESELFGHAKGAFTGAEADRPGCFEAARGGTLFLDEVASMPETVQVRLLRVLADRRVTRLGETRDRPVDVRVVAATNVRLDRRVADGTFRSDLYYRLAVFTIDLPDLAERGAEDVARLARHVLAATCERLGRGPKALTDAAIARLVAHAWPGNVRELENVLARAAIAAGTRELIDAGDLVLRSVAAAPGPEASATLPPEGMDLAAHLESLERDLIDQALERAQGNRKAAAGLLGIQRTTLVQKLARREARGTAAWPEGADGAEGRKARAKSGGTSGCPPGTTPEGACGTEGRQARVEHGGTSGCPPGTTPEGACGTEGRQVRVEHGGTSGCPHDDR